MALLDNLVSWWKLDEASGTRLDVHGDNDLTDNATVTQSAGKVGNAAQFTSANLEFLSHVSNGDLQAGDIDFTIAAWIFPDSVTGDRQIVTKDSSGNRNYTLDCSGTTPRFYINGSIIANGDAITVSNWHFLVCWHDASANTVNIQVNNAAPDSTGTTGTAPSVGAAEFRIGARQFSGVEGYYSGRIDEVALWKRLLTTDERSALWNGGAGLSYTDAGIINAVGSAAGIVTVAAVGTVLWQPRSGSGPTGTVLRPSRIESVA